MVKQISLDTWSVHHLQELLVATNFISQTNTPIVLYRETLEEKEDVFEEIVCTLTQDHVIEQVIVSGGMVIPEIKQQLVFTEEFPDRLKKCIDLFGQVVDLVRRPVLTPLEYKVHWTGFMRLLEYQAKDVFQGIRYKNCT